jgi:Zn-dependent protease with chaperone function
MRPANPALRIESAGGRRRSVLVAFGLFVVCAALAAAYFRYTAPLEAPPGYAGTAADPAVFMPSDVLERTESFRSWAYWFMFVIPSWEWLVFWVLVAAGAAARWQAFLERPRFPRFLRFPVYVLLLRTVSALLFLPFRFADYRNSVFHGVATQSVSGWFRDYALSFALDYVSMLILLGFVRWFLSRSGRWKLKLSLAVIPFVVLMNYIYPVLISPLFAPVKPMSDERLERNIMALAERAAVPVDKVYEAEMSAVTNEMNATISGIGSSVRIVVWDTMLEETGEGELLFVLAHELGHFVHRDTLVYTANNVFWTLVIIGVGGWLYERIVAKWGARWGIRRLSDLSGLPLILLLVSFLSFIVTPGANAVHRHTEAQADRYALELTGDPRSLVSSLQKLAQAGLKNPNPPLLIQWFDNHPGISKRIAAALQFEKERGGK